MKMLPPDITIMVDWVLKPIFFLPSFHSYYRFILYIYIMYAYDSLHA